MKKALFATTALVAFAGAASAEVTISGWAEMGIVGGDRFTGTLPLATQYWNDVDIEFTLSGESDSGISFGARVDLDEAGNLGNTFRNQGTSIFISGNFGTLTLGDTDGAVDWAVTDAGNIGNPGSISDDETTHAGYNADYGDGGGLYNGANPFGPAYDNQILRYDYSFGDFGFAISYEQDGYFVGPGIVIDTPPAPPIGSYDGSLAIGVRYALNLGGPTINLGAGYQTIDFGPGATNEDIVAVSVSGSFGGGFQAGVEFTQYNDAGGIAGEDVNHIGVGLGYESGPFSVHANWGQFDGNAAANAGFFGPDVAGWGLAAAYDLGGGLSVNAGVGHDDFAAPAVDNTYWSLGMVMSF
jgi:outer membrane protein OmpU